MWAGLGLGLGLGQVMWAGLGLGLGLGQVMWAGCALSLAETSTSIIFVAPKVFSRETRVATNVCLSRQSFCLFFFFFFCRDKYFCSEKMFVTTNICRDKHNFVATKVLSRHAYFCRDQHVFVATKHVMFS